MCLSNSFAYTIGNSFLEIQKMFDCTVLCHRSIKSEFHSKSVINLFITRVYFSISCLSKTVKRDLVTLDSERRQRERFQKEGIEKDNGRGKGERE